MNKYLLGLFSFLVVLLIGNLSQATILSFDDTDWSSPIASDNNVEVLCHSDIWYYGSGDLYFYIYMLDDEKDNSFHLRLSDDSTSGPTFIDDDSDYTSPSWILYIEDLNWLKSSGYPYYYSPDPDPNSPTYVPYHWDVFSMLIWLQPGGQIQVDWMAFADDANSAPPVPEPATMLLLGLGLVGLAAFKKRFSRNNF